MKATALVFAMAASLVCEPRGHAQTSTAAPDLDVRVSQNARRLASYQVFELTFQHDGRYANPTWDVTINVRFTSPTGHAYEVGGFFFGSSKRQKPVIRNWTDHRGQKRSSATWPCDPADLWKARYAPSEIGTWSYDYVLKNRAGGSARGRGGFEVVEGRNRSKGWVRISPDNPYRFVFENGEPFFPVGFQDGVFDGNHNGSAMDAKSMEGPFRLDLQDRRPVPPPGALFARGPSMNPVNGDVYFGRHARAGFNLWRFSPNNFSIKVFTMDEVHWKEAQLVDEMLRLLRKYDVRIFYGIFGFTKAFNDEPDNAEGMAKVKRLVKYSVDRWGAYVDFWELLNEQHASDQWYAMVVPHLKSIDPYRKPVATSWQRPELKCIDINAPHWYGNEDERHSDKVTAGRVKHDKRHRKPVVYGEQGNHRGREDRSAEGIGGVWDPGSARRMRVRLWTALFNEASLIFWETSYAKDGHYMNLWIGPEERQYVRALQDFAKRLDAQARMVEVSLAEPQARGVRSYGLRSDRRAAVYLHHFDCGSCAVAADSEPPLQHRWDHQRGRIHGLKVTVDVPIAGHGYWYDPRTAAVLGRFQATPGRHEYTAPPFSIDLALLIAADGPPDVDRDGKPNDADPDDDNDGVPDTRDAFPLEREEWEDADRDRIGDHFDADLDADGRADDRNDNGTPDNEEPDPDDDGVPSANAVPWDAFPLDPNEWQDTDGDGTGDNADQDDDGDGYSDKQETQANTDPKSPLHFP